MIAGTTIAMVSNVDAQAMGCHISGSASGKLEERYLPALGDSSGDKATSRAKNENV